MARHSGRSQAGSTHPFEVVASLNGGIVVVVHVSGLGLKKTILDHTKKNGDSKEG
jgi:hypothetical protein